MVPYPELLDVKVICGVNCEYTEFQTFDDEIPVIRLWKGDSLQLREGTRRVLVFLFYKSKCVSLLVTKMYLNSMEK